MRAEQPDKMIIAMRAVVRVDGEEFVQVSSRVPDYKASRIVIGS